MEGIRLFGPVSVQAPDGPRPVGGSTRQAVLAVLALHRNRFVPRNDLCAAVWERSDVEVGVQGLAALRNEISRLRSALVDVATIETGARGYRLMVADGAIDIAHFEQAVREARGAADQNPERAVELFGEALAPWTGPPFSDLSARIEALAHEAGRLDELRIDALEQRSRCLLRIGADPSALAGDLAGLVACHPFREGFWACLITALYRAGRQAEALDAFQRLRRLLAEELGIVPSPELVALEGAVLRHDPSLSAISCPAAPASDAPDEPGYVPRPLDPFFGREADLAAVSELLGTERLITVTGPGGCGKTRLAIELARAQARRFSAGAWFCELASVPDAASVGYTVAERIGVKQAAGQSIIESLAGWAAPRRMLVVLDNCEHVGSAAAELAGTLLRRCPDVVVVATSREPLDVVGEHVWRLSPLRAGAVALFEDRAARVGSRAGDRATVEAICERLDHLPLAIELAAARCRFLSPAEVLERLDRQMEVLKDRSRATDLRHSTMRAAITWSYDALEATEQRVLRAASVFRGGFTLGAIAEITSGGVLDVSDAVETLVIRSLVSVEPRGSASRYRMLEPPRQFAADQLDSGESADLQRRHATYFAQVAREIGAGYESPDHVLALGLFEAEFANLRLAQQYLVGVGDLDAASRLVGGIAEIATYRMQFEVLAWFDAEQSARRACRHALLDDVDNLPITALFEAGRLDATIGLAGRIFATPSAAPRTRILAHIVCAWSLANTGHLGEVIEHIDAAVRCAREERLAYWVIEAVASRSQIAARIGARPDIASRAGREAIAAAGAYGNQSQLSLAYALGHHAAKNDAERLELLRRGFDDGRASGNLLMAAVCAYQLGDYLARVDGALDGAAGPFLLAIDQFSRARVLTQLWNVFEIIAQRWADHGQLDLPLVIWGCATAHDVQPITTALPTTPTAHERKNIIAAARARRDPTFDHGRRLTVDQLVTYVSDELTRVATSV